MFAFYFIQEHEGEIYPGLGRGQADMGWVAFPPGYTKGTGCRLRSLAAGIKREGSALAARRFPPRV